MKKIKIFFTLIILLTFLVAPFSCSKGSDDNPEEPISEVEITEPSPTQIGIDVNGLDDIDYNGAIALSPDVEEQINTNGIFEDPYTDNGIEDLPVLIVKNEALLFGYFPHTMGSNKVSIDDILLFYLLTYPEISVQGVEYQTILNEVTSSADYSKMKGLIINDLNKNLSPGDNDNLTGLIRSFSQSFVEGITSKTSNTKGQEIVGEFKFTYSRDGEIKWLDEVPLFAAVGLSIKNDITGEVVLPPKILKTKSLVLSPTSIIAWTYKEIYNQNDPNSSSFIMPDFGSYTVSFSNGNGISKGDLNKSVRDKNIVYIASNLMGYAIPFSIKFLNIQPSCANSIQGLKDDAFVQTNQLLLKGDVPSSSDVLKAVLGLSANIVEIYSECLEKANAKLYVKLLAGALAKKLQLAEDISTLMFLVRDFLGSDISGNETRHYSNEVSFGELKVAEPYVFFDLEGFPEDKFEYKKTIQEKVIAYDVDRGLSSSSFIPKEEWIGAINLPFNVTVASGNASIENGNIGDPNPINLNPDGLLAFTMVTGDVDSEIKVAPIFESPIVSLEIIKLKVVPENKPFSLTTTNIDFGDVQVNRSGTEVLTITNNLDYDLTINTISGFPTWVLSSFSNGVIPAKSSQDVNLTFIPSEIKAYDGELTIETDFTDFTENKVQIIGNGIAETGELFLSGDLNFGSVSINTSVTKVLNINNPSSIPVVVTSINLPNGYVAAWTSGTIQPSETFNVDITFTPTSIQDYSGTITVNNDADQVNNTIAITGSGIENTGSMLLSANLNFGDVAINTSSAKTLSITNNGSAIINISSISLPDGFTANWTSGSIGGNASQDVIITFLPAAVQQYSGNLVVNNDTDQENNKIFLNGNGIDSNGTISIEGNLDFGVVPIDEPNEKTITIINNSQSSVNISSINLPSDYFTANWTSGTISPGGSQSIVITFTPTEIKDYTGTLVIDNDLDNINNKVNITGRGSKLFADALVVKEILRLNGKNVSDTRWNSKNIQEVIDVVLQNNCEISNERIRGLHWTDYGLTTIPSEIGQLDALWTIGFALNSIQSLPPEIGDLKGLAYLALNYNNLSYLPESLGNLTNLVDLHLNNNELVSLPFSIGNLTKLDHLRLAKNRLSSLPSSISNLSSLDWLDMETNNFTSLPSYIGVLPKLRHLDVSRNNLTSLPIEIGNLVALRHLIIHNNNLTILPESIGNLSVFDIIAHHNSLNSIPTSIGNLNQIVRLEFDYNNLTALPSSIGNLSTLGYLRLKYNSLTSLPESIGNLTNMLYGFDLSYNSLSSLPNSIGSLNISSLNLSNNNFSSVPSILTSLTNLNYLSLNSNNISSVPAWVGNLTNLNSLGLAGNEGLLCLPSNVWSLGCDVVSAGLVECNDTDCSE